VAAKKNALLIHPDDNVVVVFEAIPANGTVCWDEASRIEASQEIPVGHKVAVSAIETGAIVRKYGQPIAVAANPIAAGEHVHVHNTAGETE
jgi:altronate hydrolase